MPQPSDSQFLEQRGLRLSIFGALFMALLGIGFAVLTSSDAVLMDGLFSLVGCVVGFIALRVAALVMQPGDDRFHFGYAAYEPMLNLTKGLLMAFITLFALVSAVMTVAEGGREVQAGWASVYALIAAGGCITIAASQWKLSQNTHSPLLNVDAKNWLIDGILSFAVLVAFVGTYLMSGTRFDPWLPYADPLVVIVLVLLSLPIPAQVIRENWNQLVGKAPTAEIQQRASTAAKTVFDDATDVTIKIRMQQIGRVTYIQLYVICEDSLDATLELMDECRASVQQSLSPEFDHLSIDIIFTKQLKWFAASVGAFDANPTEHQLNVESKTPTKSETDGREEGPIDDTTNE